MKRIIHRMVMILATMTITSGAMAQTNYYVAQCGDDAWSATSPVCAAPDGPKRTLQAGITAAINGDTVIVADGIYTGLGNKDLDFAGKAITVRAYAPTAIDCGGEGRAFHFHSQEDQNAVLDGFRIVNGSMPEGGAILCDNGSNPTIRNCTFSNNVATGVNTCTSTDFFGGGALRCNASSPTLTNCVFSANQAQDGGAVFNDAGSSPTLIGCVFENNVAAGYPCSTGGAVNNWDGSTATLIDCSFTGNRAHAGGVISVWQTSDLRATNCTFAENTADLAGAIVGGGASQATFVACDFTRNSSTDGPAGALYWQEPGTVSLWNCTFAGNVATNPSALSNGGAINIGQAHLSAVNSLFVGNRTRLRGGALNLVNSASATLTNCTFVDNRAGQSGGAAFSAGGVQSAFTNSILWGNAAPVGPQINGSATVTYTDVQGGYPGLSNIDADPLFTSPPDPGDDSLWGTPDDDYGNLRLMSGSPCIDSGDPAFIPPPGAELDLAGRVRIWDGDGDGLARVDMGAYEFGSPIPGDLDGDCAVGLQDLAMLLAHFGAVCAPAPCSYTNGDLDGDVDVDLSDLAALLSAFGTTCP